MISYPYVLVNGTERPVVGLGLTANHLLAATHALCAQPSGSRFHASFQGLPAYILSNQQLEFTILAGGGAFAGLVRLDDPLRLNPPLQAGADLAYSGAAMGRGGGEPAGSDGFAAISRIRRPRSGRWLWTSLTGEPRWTKDAHS